MIRFFRNYRKTVFGSMIVLGGVILMTSFGVNFRSDHNADRAAVTIDDTKISHQKFYDEQKRLERQYRMQFGKNFDQLRKYMNLNLAQETVDRLIQETVVINKAEELGLHFGETEILEAVKRDFPQGYDERALQRVGMTPTEYLDLIQKDAMRLQLLGVIADSNVLSERELKALFQQRETEYSVKYTEFNVVDIEKELPAPSEDELKSWYESKKSDYEIPPRIKYEYVAFSPDAFLSQIEIPEDEVELYYTDNQKSFTTPEELKLRQIQVSYPKSEDPKELAKARQKATEALEKAKAGEKFEDLVKKYSDDAATSSKGGDLGWVIRGKYGKAYDEKSYAKKDGGLADLIETDTGFYVVKVEGYHESKNKPLAEVKDEIVKKLRTEQAPAYADSKAREFFDKFTGTEKPLAEFAKENQLSAAVTNGLLTESDDPDSSLPGLTRKVMNGSGDAKQVIDLKEKTIVVNLLDQKDSEIPPLSEIREKVEKAVKADLAQKEAQKRAQSLLDDLKNSSTKKLEDVLKDKKTALKNADGLKQSKPGTGVFKNPDLLRAITTTQEKFALPESVIKADNSYVVYQVNEIKPPAKEGDSKALQAIWKEEQNKHYQIMASSLIAALKARAKIETDPSILLVSDEA